MLTGIRQDATELPAERQQSVLANRLAARVRGATQAKPLASLASETTTETQAPASEPDSQNRGLAPEGSAQSAEPAEQQDGATKDQQPEETPAESSRKQKKWNALIAKNRAANEENASLKAELDAMKAEMAALRNGHTPQAQPKPEPRRNPLEFAEPFPEEGTHEQQLAWHARKAARQDLADLLPGMLREAFGNFAQVLEPIIQNGATQIADKRWQSIAPKLEAAGIPEGVRPVVESVLAENPGLSIPEALGRVLFDERFDGHWQQADEPAPAAAPTQPKAPARPAGPARAASARGSVGGPKSRADALNEAVELRKAGQTFQSRQAFGRLMASLAGKTR